MNELQQLYKLCNEQIMLVQTDLNGIITDINENYSNYTGYSRAELIGNDFKILRHPGVSSKFYVKFWESLKRDKEVSSLLYNKTKNNQTVVSKSYITAWYDENKNHIGYKALIIDKTSDYREKQQLKKELKYLQSIIDLLPTMIIVSDSEEMIIGNRALCNFVGFKNIDEFKKHHKCICEKFIVEEGYLQQGTDWIQEAKILSLKGLSAKVKILGLDANEYIFLVSSFSIEGTKDSLVIFTDITEQENEKEELKQDLETINWELMEAQNEFSLELERFEYAINSSRDGFWDLDFRTNELYLSPGWKKRLGFETNQEVTYIDYTKLIKSECVPTQVNAMLKVLEQKPVSDEVQVAYSLEYTIVTNQGEEILVEDSGHVLYNEDKNPYRVVGFHRDVTQKNIESKKSNQQAKLASLGEMIGNIAHQWRQPISAINGIVNDLEFEIDLDELDNIPSQRVKDVSKDIHEFTDYLSKTIDDFRNFMKTDRVKEQFNLLTSLSDSINIVNHTFVQKNIVLENNVNIDEMSIFGFPRELSQVIVNILNNAKDALVEKKIANPKVAIDLELNEDFVVVNIKDNAGGIPEEIIEKVFDPYFTTKHESIGTGIGLSMSKNIIDSHFNGLLSVQNDKEGAVFSIKLPI